MLVGNRHEDFDYLRVKLRARAAANLFTGMGHRQSSAVGAVADHGVEGVGYGEYSGAEGDLLLFEATGIAGTVEKLLMGEDDLCSIPQERNANEHVVADLAVPAHDLLFVVVQGARFAEDDVRDGHLSD